MSKLGAKKIEKHPIHALRSIKIPINFMKLKEHTCLNNVSTCYFQFDHKPVNSVSILNSVNCNFN